MRDVIVVVMTMPMLWLLIRRTIRVMQSYNAQLRIERALAHYLGN